MTNRWIIIRQSISNQTRQLLTDDINKMISNRQATKFLAID